MAFVKDINLNIAVAIDCETAIANSGGETEMYYHLLSKFEEMTLAPKVRDIVAHVNTLNHYEIKEAAHAIKGGAGYIGASRLYY